MNSNVAKSDSVNKCLPFHHRLSAFSPANFALCCAIPSLLTVICIQTAKGSLFMPPHLVPISPIGRGEFGLPNAHFFRVIVHPPPFHFSLPFSTPSPRPWPNHWANSAQNPTQLRPFESSQNTWRVVLGEICQLPNFLRPTENSSTFAECEQLHWGIAELLNRSDLGFWRLRSCPSDTLFVPLAQHCLTRRSVILQNKICSKKSLSDSNDGKKALEERKENELDANYANYANYSLCPPGDANDLWMTVRRKRPVWGKNTEEKALERKRGEIVTMEEEEKEVEEEEGESAEEDGTESDMEVVEPCRVRIEQNGKDKAMHRQLAKCPCVSDNCICMESRLPRLFSACCCPTIQTAPCLCPAAPPHFVTSDDKLLPDNQMPQQKLQAKAPQGTSRDIGKKVSEGKEKGNSDGPGDFVPFSAGIEQPRHCPLIDQNMGRFAQYQALCSWMLDPLVADSESRTHFFQCQPAPFSLFCGRWQRMPCAPKTVFDQKEQMCLWEDHLQQQRGEERENELLP